MPIVTHCLQKDLDVQETGERGRYSYEARGWTTEQSWMDCQQ